MLPQFICILDPSFRLEERFFLRIQFQRSAIEVDGTRWRFDFVVQGHGRGLMDLQGFCDRQTLGCGEADFIDRTTALDVRRLFSEEVRGRRLFGCSGFGERGLFVADSCFGISCSRGPRSVAAPPRPSEEGACVIVPTEGAPTPKVDTPGFPEDPLGPTQYGTPQAAADPR